MGTDEEEATEGKGTQKASINGLYMKFYTEKQYNQIYV